jgi:hypothetical protein
VNENSKVLKEHWLKLKAPVAIVQACNTHHVKEALQIYFGKWHRNKIFTPGGIKRLWLICKAAIISTD